MHNPSPAYLPFVLRYTSSVLRVAAQRGTRLIQNTCLEEVKTCKGFFKEASTQNSFGELP